MLTVVKTKAALHYESNIAELYAAGADVGDYGHSRHMFVPMLKAACTYVDKEVSTFLSTPLSNTGFSPHFYVTSDKSTIHRTTNQVTLVCPVVEGQRQAIALNACRVYLKSDGSGGTGPELVATILSDVKNHAGIKGCSIFGMQGKVTDRQYLIDGLSMQRTNLCLKKFQLTSRISFGGHFNGTQATGLTRCSPNSTTTTSSCHVY